MESKLLDYLMQEKTKELKTQFAAREAAFAAREAALEAQLQLQVERDARQRAELEAQLQLQAEREAHHRAELEAQLQLQAVVTQQQQALQETLVLRFPHLPPTLLLAVQRVTNPTVLSQLSVAAMRAADLSAFEHTLQQALAEP